MTTLDTTEPFARRLARVALVVAVIVSHPIESARAALEVWREFRADG